jgi:hypothetical protein
VTPLDRLREAVLALTSGGLLDLLGDLLPPGAGAKQEGGTHQKISGSPAPWSGPAAGVLMAIHAGARELEADLFYRRFRQQRRRGGSDENTRLALAAIEDLASALPEPVQRDAAGRVESWVDAARRITAIGEADSWDVLPREPGQLPPPCPHCELFSLRFNRRTGIVRCTTRHCRNEDSSRHEWRLEELPRMED